jgi:hypothetical protein
MFFQIWIESNEAEVDSANKRLGEDQSLCLRQESRVIR